MEFGYWYATGTVPNPGSLALTRKDENGAVVAATDWRTATRLELHTLDKDGQVSTAALIGKPAGGNEIWIRTFDFPPQYAAFSTHGVILNGDRQTVLINPKWSSLAPQGGIPFEDEAEVAVEVKTVAPNAWQYAIRTDTTDVDQGGNGFIIFNALTPSQATEVAVGERDLANSDPTSLFYAAWVNPPGGLLNLWGSDSTVPFYTAKILGSRRGAKGAGIFRVEYFDWAGAALPLKAVIEDRSVVNLQYMPPGVGAPVVPDKWARFVTKNAPSTPPGPNELKVAVWQTAQGQVKGVYVWQEKVDGKPVTPRWVKVA